MGGTALPLLLLDVAPPPCGCPAPHCRPPLLRRRGRQVGGPPAPHPPTPPALPPPPAPPVPSLDASRVERPLVGAQRPEEAAAAAELQGRITLIRREAAARVQLQRLTPAYARQYYQYSAAGSAARCPPQPCPPPPLPPCLARAADPAALPARLGGFRTSAAANSRLRGVRAGAPAPRPPLLSAPLAPRPATQAAAAPSEESSGPTPPATPSPPPSPPPVPRRAPFQVWR
eukprot:TRINITY_DN1939_c0_g2_i1.p1 TRINITY_DN1939_c0_g2~~TRINITY_DN1939_c0_g2_i1.p1  ORF type:complete len:257 (+),score=33.43 TRINITY_DN1939_c0_g2_i1:83-772(+)